MPTPLQICISSRNLDFPAKLDKTTMAYLLKHLATCARGVSYSTFQLDDFLDGTIDTPTGRPGMRLASPGTVWIAFIDAVNFYFARYGVNLNYGDFNGSEKTLRNFRDFIGKKFDLW